MKRITKDNQISIIQFALAIIAFVFYIAYSLLANPIFQDFSDIAEWRISRVIYAVPYILCLLSIILGKYRNPRKSASHFLTAFSFSFVPSFLDLIIYPPLILIENDFSFTMIKIILTFLISGGLLLSFWMPEIDEIVYSTSCFFIASIAFGYAITNVFGDDFVQSLNMLAFSFLRSSIAFYGLKFSEENKYTPKYYELLGLDDCDDMDFDYIVDSITDMYLTSELYANAVDARNFYYAIKYDDKEKLSDLNITGIENIKSVLELWLKFENEFAASKEKHYSLASANICCQTRLQMMILKMYSTFFVKQ